MKNPISHFKNTISSTRVYRTGLHMRTKCIMCTMCTKRTKRTICTLRTIRTMRTMLIVRIAHIKRSTTNMAASRIISTCSNCNSSSIVRGSSHGTPHQYQGTIAAGSSPMQASVGMYLHYYNDMN